MDSREEAAELLRSILGNNVNSLLSSKETRNISTKQVTLSNGKRIQLIPKKEDTLKKERDTIESLKFNQEDINQLVNINSLLERIKIDEITKNELSKFEEKENKFEENNREFNKITNLNNNKQRNKKGGNLLWTEKYRPHKFLDLIGNERINSNILKWLNEWNYVVNGGKLIDSNEYNRDNKIDPLKRPNKKILLIYGSPGIGKTSIAQCICRQLGYEISEINSSDERGGDKIKEKINNSLRMNNLNGKKNCLILDEIDGAINNENGFIKKLIYLLNKDKKVVEEWTNFNKLRFNKKEDFIRRPMIAICNEIGSNCLEQLKPYCEIIKFPKSSKKNIKKRLKFIIKNEKISELNESLLDELIISLDGDIRNCINFLQFQSNNLNGKLKDIEINWFQILKEIFNIDYNNNNYNKLNKNKDNIFQDLKNKLTNCNFELNKINNGCFNLILNLIKEDEINEEITKLNKLNKISEWNYFQDLINKNSKKFELDEISIYESITPLKYFNLFTDINKSNFKFKYNNKIQFKNKENFDKRRIILEIINKLLIEYKFNINKNEMIINEIFMINNIILPIKNKIKGFENKEIKINDIIKIIKGLKIKIEINDNKIKTNINRNWKNNINKFNPNIVYCKIGGEIEDIQDRGEEEEEEEDNRNNINEIKASPYIKIINEIINKRKNIKRVRDDKEEEEEERDGNIKNKCIDKNNKLLEKNVNSIDYFKRQYKSFQTQMHKEINQDSKGVMQDNDNRIWIKYHEGFSNAVRKEIVWNDLFE